MPDLRSRFELEAQTLPVNQNTAMLVSIAISMKRIADALEKLSPENLDLHHVAYNAGMAFQGGMNRNK